MTDIQITEYQSELSPLFKNLKIAMAERDVAHQRHKENPSRETMKASDRGVECVNEIETEILNAPVSTMQGRVDRVDFIEKLYHRDCDLGDDEVKTLLGDIGEIISAISPSVLSGASKQAA